MMPTAAEHSRVLVVDDDPKAVEVIAAFLPSPGYEVVRAYSGSQAITLAQRMQPDLLLLDLMMPEIDGFAVVKALQDDPATAHIPILIVTARQVSALERATLDSNAGKVLPIIAKAGFNSVAFITEVRRALRAPLERTSDGQDTHR